MPFETNDKLIIGVASSALFDLTASDTIFKQKGEAEYRNYQKEKASEYLQKGVAFSFIRRLLSLNNLSDDPETQPLVEVILLSRNDPYTGLRVMNTIKYYELPITRAIFTQGKCPYQYSQPLGVSLFLSANEDDVRQAIAQGVPAGQVVQSKANDDENDDSLRIAFDFDGVLIDDEPETVMQTHNLERFHRHESENRQKVHEPGPLKNLLLHLCNIQKIEERKKRTESQYELRVRVSVVTARNAPSHERAIHTLTSWGAIVNEAFFLGGINKGAILSVMRPHIFFEDQLKHIDSARSYAPCVHIPYGALNQSIKAGSSISKQEQRLTPKPPSKASTTATTKPIRTTRAKRPRR